MAGDSRTNVVGWASLAAVVGFVAYIGYHVVGSAPTSAPTSGRTPAATSNAGTAAPSPEANPNPDERPWTDWYVTVKKAAVNPLILQEAALYLTDSQDNRGRVTPVSGLFDDFRVVKARVHETTVEGDKIVCDEGTSATTDARRLRQMVWDIRPHSCISWVVEIERLKDRPDRYLDVALIRGDGDFYSLTVAEKKEILVETCEKNCAPEAFRYCWRHNGRCPPPGQSWEEYCLPYEPCTMGPCKGRTCPNE